MVPIAVAVPVSSTWGPVEHAGLFVFVFVVAVFAGGGGATGAPRGVGVVVGVAPGVVCGCVFVLFCVSVWVLQPVWWCKACCRR